MFLAAAPAGNNLLGMHWLDWAVLAAYFILIVAIGWWSLKKVKDMSDFFMGGRRFGKVFMMFFAFGAGTSSEQAISVVAGTWRVGLAGIWWQFLWLWATPFYWIVAPVMRRMRALTTADFFEHRYNTGTATLYTIYGIIMAIVFIAAGLFSSGKMVNALTGGELDRVATVWNVQVPVRAENPDTQEMEWTTRRIVGYEYAILAMTVLFVTYGMAGGLGAAIITDFIQGVLTIAFSFLLLPFVFQKIGGFGHLHDYGEVKAGMFNMVASADIAAQLGKEQISIFFVVMLSLTALTGIVVQPHIMGVCGAGKTEFEGRFGFTVGNFLKRFCTIAWTFTGLACIVWYLTPDLSPLPPEELARLTPGNALFDVDFSREFSDDLFGRAAYEILPTIAPGLVGLLLASLLAAVMSTSYAQMIVGSGLFTENIYRRFIRKNASDRHYLWAGRLAGLGIVFAAIVLQTGFEDVIHALKIIIQTPAAIGISFWFGIVWRRWNAVSVWASTLSAVAAWWFVANHADWLFNAGLPESMFLFKEVVSEGGIATQELTGMGSAWVNLAYIGTGVVVGLLASLLTSRQSKGQLDRFFSLIHTPVTPGEEVSSPCTQPENPALQNPTMFAHPDIELPKPTLVGLGGFAVAWGCVGFIIWLTSYLAKTL